MIDEEETKRAKKKLMTDEEALKLVVILITKNVFSDKNLLNILRLLFRNHFEYFITSKIILSFNNYKNKYPKTYSMLLKLYYSVYKTNEYERILDKFIPKIVVGSDKFSIIKLIEFMEDKHLLLKAYFDRNGMRNCFITRINRTDNMIFDEEILKRLIGIKRILGNNFFNVFEIKQITMKEFDDMTHSEKCVYMNDLFKNIDGILKKTLMMLKHNLMAYDFIFAFIATC